MDSTDDDRLNNIMGAGAVLAALHSFPGDLKPEIIYDEHGTATNRIRVRLHFMKSPYVVTVEREASEEPTV